MRALRSALPLALATLLASGSALAAEPLRVEARDLHLDRLHPATLTYLVYNHGGSGAAIEPAMLATTRVKRERVDGTDAWVVEQDWTNTNGQYHTARTVHAAKDAATLSQTSTWNRPTGRHTSTVTPATGTGTIQGELPPEARKKMEAGFAAMKDGWWFNWHSDLTYLPLLPYEKGGTLRIRLFDVGMQAPMDVDYTVVGERKLQGGDGTVYDCWLVETESGHPGNGAYQRFWIDKTRRLVIKEEDTFFGKYRSKILLSVPAITEFPQTSKAPPATGS